MATEKIEIGQQKKIKLMAYSDGYAMVRYPGCMPFIVSKKELAERFNIILP